MTSPLRFAAIMPNPKRINKRFGRILRPRRLSFIVGVVFHSLEKDTKASLFVCLSCHSIDSRGNYRVIFFHQGISYTKMNPTPPFSSFPQPHRPPAAAPTRLMRPPFVDTQTNIMYDVNDPEYEGWLTKQSTWLKVRAYKRAKGAESSSWRRRISPTTFCCC